MVLDLPRGFFYVEGVKTLPRAALLLPGGLALLTGLDAALLLLGLPAPVTTERLPQLHGGLLVLGFLGTVIALERAVALRATWAFTAPAALGLGALVTLTSAPLAVGRGMLVAGTVGLVAVYAALWRRQGSEALGLQVLGAVLAVGGASLWAADVPVPTVLAWFAGFVVLTIAGERLELARIAIPEGAERLLGVLGRLLLLAVPASTLWPTAGHVALGLVLLALVGTLLVHDVARRTVRAAGLPRYSAWCLLAGYVWLAVAGAVWAAQGRVDGGTAYDAVVHAVFLGFTISMIMAHAPVILPAVLGRPLPYRPHLYVPVALLHVSLVLRLGLGDLHGQPWAVRAGGVLGIVALLTFLGMVVVGLVRGDRGRVARSSARRPTPADTATELEEVAAR